MTTEIRNILVGFGWARSDVVVQAQVRNHAVDVAKSLPTMKWMTRCVNRSPIKAERDSRDNMHLRRMRWLYPIVVVYFVFTKYTTLQIVSKFELT